MSARDLGVLATSRLENERRLPIHPASFGSIPADRRARMTFERGYGVPFGVSDARIGELFGGVASREELLAEAGVVLLPKMQAEDLREVREGGVVWGWPHCVQQRATTQAAIDRRLTLLAFEEMHRWTREGARELHLFYRNNEMAGYCAVLHAMGLAGLDGGSYGQPLRAVVLSFGSVSRGAIYALKGLGAADIQVFTQRPAWAVHDRVPGCRFGQLRVPADGGALQVIDADGRERALIDVLAESDVIVNGILQDTDKPLMFVDADDVRHLRHGTLVVDVSCDLGMGFSFARPTSFEEPTFEVGPVTYYAVDHTPSYLWRSATWELSQVVLAFLDDVLAGPEGWERNESLRRAVEIRDGVVQNPRILSFQGRAADWPHASQA